MSEIARTGKWNPGGGRWLDIVPAYGVASYGRASLASAPQITFRPGFGWSRIYCTPGTLQYRERTGRDDNGLTYQLDLKGFSPDDSPTKRSQLESLLRYGRMLVRFCDNQGLIRTAGTPVETLDFDFELATDADVPGSRGYSLTLTGTSTLPPAYE